MEDMEITGKVPGRKGRNYQLWNIRKPPSKWAAWFILRRIVISPYQ